MPELSRFYGIVIAMYYDEHPPPHFHAIYGSEKAEFVIDPPGLLKGSMSPRAISLIIEWAWLHRDELLEAWEQREAGRRPRHIEPLR